MNELICSSAHRRPHSLRKKGRATPTPVFWVLSMLLGGLSAHAQPSSAPQALLLPIEKSQSSSSSSRAALANTGNALSQVSQAKRALPAAVLPGLVQGSASQDSSAMVAAAQNARYPLPIAAMLAKGKNVLVLDAFVAQGGLTGFVLSAGNGERRLYYVTPDGAVAVYGMAFDSNLNNLTARDFAQYTNALSNTTGVGTLIGTKAPGTPATAAVGLAAPGFTAQASQGETSRPTASAPTPELLSAQQKLTRAQTAPPAGAPNDLWSTAALAGPEPAGSTEPSRAVTSATSAAPALQKAWSAAIVAQGAFIEGKGLPVYIVIDLACPFCHKTYEATRPLLGKLQIHWIVVGALGPRSQLLAETFLRSTNKGQALAAAVSNELLPAQSLSAEATTVINNNADILKIAGTTSVPLTLFMLNGQIKKINGAPSDVQLKELVRLASLPAMR